MDLESTASRITCLRAPDVAVNHAHPRAPPPGPLAQGFWLHRLGGAVWKSVFHKRPSNPDAHRLSENSAQSPYSGREAE